MSAMKRLHHPFLITVTQSTPYSQMRVETACNYQFTIKFVFTQALKVLLQIWTVYHLTYIFPCHFVYNHTIRNKHVVIMFYLCSGHYQHSIHLYPQLVTNHWNNLFRFSCYPIKMKRGIKNRFHLLSVMILVKISHFYINTRAHAIMTEDAFRVPAISSTYVKRR